MGGLENGLESGPKSGLERGLGGGKLPFAEAYEIEHAIRTAERRGA